MHLFSLCAWGATAGGRERSWSWPRRSDGSCHGYLILQGHLISGSGSKSHSISTPILHSALILPAPPICYPPSTSTHTQISGHTEPSTQHSLVRTSKIAFWALAAKTNISLSSITAQPSKNHSTAKDTESILSHSNSITIRTSTSFHYSPSQPSTHPPHSSSDHHSKCSELLS